MNIPIRARAAAAVLTATALGAASLAAADATTASFQDSRQTATAGIPTVVVRMSDSAVHLSVGHRLHAGRVEFRVRAKSGGDALQLMRLHKGYTMREAQRDFNKAFGGNTDAIKRVDRRITFLGGAQARPGHPGRFAVVLHAGRFIVLSQNADTFTRLRVFGTPPDRPTVRSSGSITAFTYGFGVTGAPLPNKGWTSVSDRSDQPHVVIFQHVKDGTTARQVRRALRSQQQPPWLLKANTSTGVLSPNRREVFHYNLPAGRYLLLCYWPDDDTGMPHYLMGMWKLVNLR
jgi:hypothetical protein